MSRSFVKVTNSSKQKYGYTLFFKLFINELPCKALSFSDVEYNYQ